MAYTKGYAIEQVLIAVNAGILTADSAVQREDIEPYLAAAVNEALGVYKKEDFANQLRGKRAGVSVPANDNNIYLSYIVDVTDLDCVKGFVAPMAPSTIQGEMLYSVSPYPVTGFIDYVKLKSPGEIAGMPVIDTVFYYHDKSPQGVVNISFIGVPTSKVMFSVAGDIMAASDDTVLPVSLDHEKMIIDLCYQFFMRSKMGIQDVQTDNKETR